MVKSDTAWQERLRRDDKKALTEVYQKHRQAFIQYAKRFNLSQEDLMDVYQDAVIAMHQNFVMKQLKLENTSIKTYLFGIGKNMIFSRLKENSKYQAAQEVPDEVEEVQWEKDSPTEEQRKLAKYFGKLGASCQEILKMFYYRSLTVKEIVAMSHYKDENTVKSHKSRCLKKLTQLVNQIT
jgi:RNA polymerase sigma-70 factor (ECF subfamily)